MSAASRGTAACAAFALRTALLATALLPLRAVDADAAEITPAAQQAVERGLGFLTGTQRPDGAWPGSFGQTTGIVASCVLSYCAAGQVPGRGVHGGACARSVQWLLRKAQPDGLLYAQGMEGQPMYHHGLAALALAEVWGQTSDPRVGDVLKKAIERIIASQNNEGGWRYQPRISDADLSVTVMQLMALRAAKDAGIAVPRETIERGIAYVKACANAKAAGKDGGFGYTPGKPSGFARTGAGVTSLQVAGDYRAAEVQGGVEYLLTFRPVGQQEAKEFYHYGHYYAAQGIYQSQSLGDWGKAAWRAWYPGVVGEMLSSQRSDGSWNGGHGAYSHAMALLVLEIPFRYLPIYQR